jgi:RHS repeat-associated protein
VIQETSNFGTQIGYYYDALGNRVSKAIGKETNRKLKTDLMEWMKGVDREAQLRLAPEDITLAEALQAKRALKCLPNKDRTWLIDHTKNRREEENETQKKALPANTALEMIQYMNDYTQEYVSPLQQTTSNYQGYKKKTTEATLFYDQRGTAVGDDLDTYHQDGLGSVITQTSKENGTLYSSNLYESFGRSERPIFEQAGYRSQYHENWKQQHLRAREYDTTTGRFQQLDTVVGQTDNPLTQHKYLYANNNPMKYRDDAGRASWLSKACNVAKNTVKKVTNVVNKSVVQPAVKVAKKTINTVAKTVEPVVNLAKYVKKVSIDYTQKRAVAQVKKQCDSAGTLKTDTQRIKAALEIQFGKPVGGYYTINGVKVPESQMMSWVNSGKIGGSTPIWIKQLFKGSYSDETSVFGTLMEILVGGIPVIGDIGDIRDMVHGFQTGNWWEVAASGLGFIPFFGGLAKKGAQAAVKESVQSAAKETAQNTGKNIAREILIDSTQIQKKFKHAEDFGISGNFNKQNALEFEKAIKNHVNSSSTSVIGGTYRGQSVTHYLDKTTGLNVLKDSSGNFLSGWKLNSEQLKNVIERGSL